MNKILKTCEELGISLSDEQLEIITDESCCPTHETGGSGRRY